MQPHFEGDFQFRSHTVHTGHQDGIKILRFINSEETTEAANLAEHAPGEGFVRQVLDALLGPVGAVDVHPRVSVGDRRSSGSGFLGH